VDQINSINTDRKILSIEGLPERDHDFIIKTVDKEVTVQLTELSAREYCINITKEEYNSGKWEVFASKEGETIPWAIDVEKKNGALKRLIQKKVEKNYSR